MNLLLQTDDENDACYIAFGLAALNKGAVARSQQVSEDMVLDFDKEGHLVGLDIMNASKVSPGLSENPRLDILVGVKEAAALAGMQRSNFVRDLASRAGFPAPVSELATGRVWLRSQVEEYLAAHKPGTRKVREASKA
jgi:uncharacterized protein YuzE